MFITFGGPGAPDSGVWTDILPACEYRSVVGSKIRYRSTVRKHNGQKLVGVYLVQFSMSQ
jgi:hypothetical protein